MKKKTLTGLVMVIFLSILAVVIGSHAGCESKKGSEVIGFPQSFADLQKRQE